MRWWDRDETWKTNVVTTSYEWVMPSAIAITTEWPWPTIRSSTLDHWQLVAKARANKTYIV